MLNLLQYFSKWPDVVSASFPFGGFAGNQRRLWLGKPPKCRHMLFAEAVPRYMFLLQLPTAYLITTLFTAQ